MASSNFIDYVKINCRSGAGGAGSVHFRREKHTPKGGPDGGDGGRRSGAQGEDVILDVPLGTIARDPESSETLTEITEEGQEVILFPGGRGGLGNDHFKSATQQAPYYAQPGEPGMEEWVVLELK